MYEVHLKFWINLFRILETYKTKHLLVCKDLLREPIRIFFSLEGFCYERDKNWGSQTQAQGSKDLEKRCLLRTKSPVTHLLQFCFVFYWSGVGQVTFFRELRHHKTSNIKASTDTSCHSVTSSITSNMRNDHNSKEHPSSRVWGIPSGKFPVGDVVSLLYLNNGLH